jgi:hypothetical protein
MTPHQEKHYKLLKDRSCFCQASKKHIPIEPRLCSAYAYLCSAYTGTLRIILLINLYAQCKKKFGTLSMSRLSSGYTHMNNKCILSIQRQNCKSLRKLSIRVFCYIAHLRAELEGNCKFFSEGQDPLTRR